MKVLKRIIKYFTPTEIIIWIFSVALTSASFFIFDGKGYFSYFASLIGITALILCAKGNPLGQFLCIVFGTMYAIISFGFAYYGEVVTYGLMTVPMAILSFVAWLKNPYRGNISEVSINRIPKKEIPFIILLATLVTFLLYLALKYLGTANLLPSTISVFTSFIAVYLTFRRSPYYALAYALNDIVLVVLWILACTVDITYLSVVICFGVFLINDIYGFISWKRIEKRQKSEEQSPL